MSRSALKKPRQKKCKAASCREWFRPQNTLQQVCSPRCALELARAQQAKAERQQLRERKEKLKTRTDWLRDAQKVFNAYIRARDAEKPCISCGAPPSGNRNGGSTRDAGHYRTVGACSALRFDEANVHSQCVSCNQHKSGNIVEYRISLRQRIGDAELERLEFTNPLRAWSIEEAKEIKREYQAKRREFLSRESM